MIDFHIYTKTKQTVYALLKSGILALFLSPLIINSHLAANSNADAMAFSGSYSTRARATQANYWNPANLVFPYRGEGELLLWNSSLNLSNNAVSIRKYNELNGKYLRDNDKERIINSLDKELYLTAGFTQSVGIAMKNFAITGSFNFHSKARFSTEYIELLLYGNEYNRFYTFDSETNSIDAVAYTDITYGQSLYSFDILGQTIHTGAALSLLHGLFILDTTKYDSEFYVSDKGLYFDQYIAIKKGSQGTGLKSLIGIRTDFDEQFSLSLTVDNLIGFIHWAGDNDITVYEAKVDNVYLSSLAKDVVIRSDSTRAISGFTTRLHPSLHLGTQYDKDDFSLSIDWKQGFTNSVLTSKTPEIGMGLEYNKINFLPLRLGFRPSLGAKPFSVSYGVALRADKLSLSLGVESVKAVIPSSFSEGISIAFTSKWSF